MASKTASRLKSDWMEMPDDCFEPLTFGELEVGQKFITLPLPGDNRGHGGFKRPHYIFTKTQQRAGLPRAVPHGSARNDKRGISSDFPDSMFVIIVG